MLEGFVINTPFNGFSYLLTLFQHLKNIATRFLCCVYSIIFSIGVEVYELQSYMNQYIASNWGSTLLLLIVVVNPYQLV